MNTSQVMAGAQKMAANAKSGTLGEYLLTFSQERWLYLVTDKAGTEVTNFNTKSLKQARQWLREWLVN